MRLPRPPELILRPHLPEPVRQEPLLLALTALTACAYATFSVLRHSHYGSFAFDLGIFDQAIWHYSRFELPETTIVGLPTFLGDHFHPILLLLWRRRAAGRRRRRRGRLGAPPSCPEVAMRS